MEKKGYYNALKWIDHARVVPRLMVLGYGYIVYDALQWAYLLPEISAPQASIIATIVGASAAVFGLYANSGHTWKDD